ncbi:MAG: tetratricopeptide repeat protein [Bryobacteraceae bacterium]
MKATEADPQYLPAQSALGRSYSQIGETEKAVPHLQAALAVDTDGALHYQLSRAYQAAGRVAEAKKLLAKYEEIQKASQSAEEGEITAPAP